MKQDKRIIGDWLEAFNALLAGRAGVTVADVFASECYWRDLVAFRNILVHNYFRDGPSTDMADHHG